MTDSLWYFAYGSNMSGAIFRERRGIQALDVRQGFVEGYRLCFDIPVGPGQRGVANLRTENGSRTHGVAYLLTAAQCEHLDHTEAVHMKVYRRISVSVLCNEGEAVAAFTYQSALSDPTRKPSARYLNLLLNGAVEHGLPGEYLGFLESFELAVDERPDQVATLLRRRSS